MKAYCKRLFCAPSPRWHWHRYEEAFPTLPVPSRRARALALALLLPALRLWPAAWSSAQISARRTVICSARSAAAAWLVGLCVWLVAGGVLWMSVSVALLSPLSVSLPLSP